jgi:hypothetical protein
MHWVAVYMQVCCICKLEWQAVTHFACPVSAQTANSLEVVALKPIAKGEEITRKYSDLLHRPDQALLLYGFVVVSAARSTTDL